MPLVPLGLGFGRLGNFANTELPGRMTDSAFGLIYPCSADAIRAMNPLCTGAGKIRAPSVAAVSGVRGGRRAVRDRVAVFVEAAADRRGVGRVPDQLRRLRIATEFFREPDAQSASSR